MNDVDTSEAPAELDVRATLAGKQLIVLGGTGFLGKVWLSMLLCRYPDIGKLYLVVRARSGLNPKERFASEIVSSPAFDPLREQLGRLPVSTPMPMDSRSSSAQPGSTFDDFIRQKIEPIDGDVKHERLGLPAAEVRELAGSIDAIVNVAGVVDFNPPLDDALDVNAFGAQNLVELARELGDIPVFHTSTCFVVGARDGVTPERNPLEFPFPRADELDPSHWHADDEIRECGEIIANARQRVQDAPRQSHLLDQAKQKLRARNEPLSGSALRDELEQVKKRYVRDQLIDAGKERAQFWGWPNIYTYTKSIGEQVLAASGVPFCLVRPSIVESALEFPVRGWCEGISTSTPIAYLAFEGQQNIPVEDKCHYDAIPVDMCAAAMIAVLARLLAGNAREVYQICSSDENPLPTKRAAQLIGLGKRKLYKNKSSGNLLLNQLQAHFEPAVVGLSAFNARSSPAVHRAVSSLRGWVDRCQGTALDDATQGLRKSLRKAERTTGNIANVFGEFIPFIAHNDMRFSAAHTRALMRSLSPADRERLPWAPEAIDWRDYWMNVQLPGMRRWSFPLLRERLDKPAKPLRRHDDLASMLDDIAERHEHSVALQRLEGDELTRLTFGQLRRRALVMAGELAQLGVAAGDRVILGAANHPDWAVAYFAIVHLGAVAVPVDKEIDALALEHIVAASECKVAAFDQPRLELAASLVDGPAPKLRCIDIHAASQRACQPIDDARLQELARLRPALAGDDLASILYTSGTTGTPKGVMLSHTNFTALIAALAPVFPLDHGDRVLSVLPLHHTFEFTCGLLLPISRGSRVIYLDEVQGERLAKAMRVGRVTAMVGVPALWELLERRITSEIGDRGVLVEQTFRALLDFNRKLGRGTGIDLGRMLFAPVHAQLGGRLRTLISGAAALPPDVYKTFQGLGLQLAEGYGLTEAAPVLTVAKATPRSRGRHVGRPIPGVEIEIADPDGQGVGEVLARGPNVMQGYADDPQSTQSALEDGWLRTGDLGHFDKRGRLHLDGRSKEVIVPTGGENVFPDDVEQRLGTPEHIKELVVVGVREGSAGEQVACLAVVDSTRVEAGVRLEVGQRSSGQERAHELAHQRAMKSLRRAIDGLPRKIRPAIVVLTDEDLPRTSTRKIQRSKARELIALERSRQRKIRDEERATPTADGRAEGERRREALYRILARIGRSSRDHILASHELSADLGFDSLMVSELVEALEREFPEVEGLRLSECRSVEDLEAVVVGRSAPNPRNPIPGSGSNSRWTPEENSREIEIPALVRQPMRQLLGRLQHQSYAHLMKTRVVGAANIPHNRATLVVANHSSHLDVGVIKHALGDYGGQLVSLGAKDYFFSNRWKRAYFGQLTNVAPIDRHAGMRKSLQEVGDYIASGRVVLIFPEGTRSPDGEMREFLPGVGQMVLEHAIDILPVHVQGAHEAFPKGANLPRLGSELLVRIGPPLLYSDLVEQVGGKKRSEAARAIAKAAQTAVEALRDGRVRPSTPPPALGPARTGAVAHQVAAPAETDRPSRHEDMPPAPVTKGSTHSPEKQPQEAAEPQSARHDDLPERQRDDTELGSTPRAHDPIDVVELPVSAAQAPACATEAPQSRVHGPESPLRSVFEDLEQRFRPGSCDSDLSFYFSLGREPTDKWTLLLGPDSYEFHNGRPAGEKADCVLKTSQKIFTRIVREGYTPGFREFVSGRVKSNDIGLLKVFQRAFGL